MKYPKTPHLPFSPGCSHDDKFIESMDRLVKSPEIVITEKLDGENSYLDRNSCHARSEQSKDHPSRHRVKALHSQIRSQIPDHIAIFGENVFAAHSIAYENLTSHFYVFAVFDKDKKLFLSWDETKELAISLGLEVVPEIYRGRYKELKKVPSSKFGAECEGYVVRSTAAIPLDSFSFYIAKYVRANHVQTDKHWSKTWKRNLGF
jgi:hypothetical protein